MMQQKFNSMRASFVLGGGCCVVMFFLLAIAYLPDFMPSKYIGLRRSGLIAIVPVIAAIGLISSFGWLWWECRAASAPDEDQEH